MFFYLDVVDHEREFAETARRAGHYRTYDASHADFLVVQSENLVHDDGSTRSDERIGTETSRPYPRFEYQVLAKPATRENIGTFRAVSQIADATGTIRSFSFSGDAEFQDQFKEFLLDVGTLDSGTGQLNLNTAQAYGVAETVEVFLTVWAVSKDDLLFDPETDRVARALVAMVGELAKTTDPPRDVLRTTFRWLAGKVEGFADGFASSAGKTLGAATALAAAAGVAGRLPDVASAIQSVLTALDR